MTGHGRYCEQPQLVDCLISPGKLGTRYRGVPAPEIIEGNDR